MPKLIIGLVLLLITTAGLKLSQWAIQEPTNTGSGDTAHLTKNEIDHLNRWSNTLRSTPMAEHEEEGQISDSTDLSTLSSTDCRDECLQGIEVLRYQVELTDDEREALLGRAGEMADYLRQHPDALIEFLEMAEAADPDKRNVIMAVFEQLDLEARLSLGQVLVESHDWHSRFDAINFLSQPDLFNSELTQQFLDMLVTDPSYYVRSSIVQALNEPALFYDDQQVLGALEQVRYTDPSYQVRGEALLAATNLLTDPQAVFPSTLSAIRSDQSGYQLLGLRALDVIFNKETLEASPLTFANRQQAEQLFDELMGPDYDAMSAESRRYADKIAEKHLGF